MPSANETQALLKEALARAARQPGGAKIVDDLFAAAMEVARHLSDQQVYKEQSQSDDAERSQALEALTTKLGEAKEVAPEIGDLLPDRNEAAAIALTAAKLLK